MGNLGWTIWQVFPFSLRYYGKYSIVVLFLRPQMLIISGNGNSPCLLHVRNSYMPSPSPEANKIMGPSPRTCILPTPGQKSSCMKDPLLLAVWEEACTKQERHGSARCCPIPYWSGRGSPSKTGTLDC